MYFINSTSIVNITEFTCISPLTLINRPSGYSLQIKRIPDTFTSFENYLNSFTWPLIEEVHADIFSSLDDYARANFIEVTQVGILDARKPILGFQVAEPMKDEKSRETCTCSA